MDDKRIKILRDAPVGQAIIKMALPAIIGLLVSAIYNVVDTMFVSWIGHEAISATQVVFPMTMLVSAIGLCFGIGGGSYISRLLGQKDVKRANQVVSTSYFSGIIIGILFTVVFLIFMDPILRAFGAMDGFMDLAREYGIYIVIGTVFQILNMVLNNSLRAEGSGKYSMIGMASGAILNIILDPIFIFTFDMGIKGAAIATTISKIVTCMILTSHYLKKRAILHIAVKYINISKSMYSEILKIGLPTLARMILTSVAIGLLNQGAGRYGSEIAIAAFGLVIKTVQILTYIIFGLSQGFQPVAGYAKGMNSPKRIKECLLFAFKASLLISLLCAGSLILFDDIIYQIYRPTSEVMAMTGHFNIVYNIGIIIMSITNVIAVYYQAMGKALPAMILSLSRQGVFLIPAILILPLFFQLDGIVYSQLTADILTLVLSVILFIPTYRKLNHEIELMDASTV